MSQAGLLSSYLDAWGGVAKAQLTASFSVQVPRINRQEEGRKHRKGWSPQSKPSIVVAKKTLLELRNPTKHIEASRRRREAVQLALEKWLPE